jgi:hypothetical protein
MSIGWFVNGEDAVLAAVRQLEHDSDRAMAVAVAAIVEIRLLDAIKNSLVNDQDVLNNLFQPDGALGGFKPRIYLAYLLGILTKEAMTETVGICLVRNHFAHKLEAHSFDTVPEKITKIFKMVDSHVGELSDARDLTAKFSGATESLRSPKLRYLMTAQLLSYALGNFDNPYARRPLI